MIRDTLSGSDRGQAYILEAILGVVLILTVTFFIAPSIATVSYQHQVNDVPEEERIENQVDSVFEKHTENGNVKKALLQFEDNDDNPNNNPPQFYLEPDNDVKNENIPYIVDLNHTTSPLAKDLREIQDEHDVLINAYIIAESPSKEKPQRIPWIFQEDPGNTIGTTSTTVTLYKTDRINSPQGAHTHLGSPRAPNVGTGTELKNITSSDPYPIKRSPHATSGSATYNTVTVRVLIFKEAKAL